VAVASAGLYASLHLIPDNHANIPLLSFFTGRMPFLPPNQQRQSTEGSQSTEGMEWHMEWQYKQFSLSRAKSADKQNNCVHRAVMRTV